MDSAPKGKVLLVEDDDQVRAFVRMLLTNNGYRVLEASTGAEGLEVAERNSSDIDLLLSDMLLPN
jgi:CheY-like chemotaxis protein